MPSLFRNFFVSRMLMESLHEVGKVHSAEELIAEAQRVVDGRGLAVMQARFLNGERALDFVEEYIDVLGRAGKVVEAGEVASVYLTGKGAECLKQRKYWTIYAAYVTDADSGLFRYVREHCGELATLYGQEAVDRKIQEVWRVGAGRFVKETEQGSWFDESGFKEYVKRLKRRKWTDGGAWSEMPGWRWRRKREIGVCILNWRRNGGMRRKYPKPSCIAGG